MAAERDKARRQEIEVWPDCWEVVQVFLSCSTQWRFTHGVATGLDYAGVQAVLALQARRAGRRLFQDLRIMELAALAAWDEKREADRWRNR